MSDTSRIDGAYVVRLLADGLPGPWVEVTPLAVSGGNVALESVVPGALTEGSNVIVP